MKVNQNKVIGVFTSEGSTPRGISNFKKNMSVIKNIDLVDLTATAILSNDLSCFDIIAFTGGSGSKQAASLGAKGRAKIKNYVKNGGRYLGICAGAYLATTGFKWSLGLINVETVSQTQWQRGEGFVDINLTKQGAAIFPFFSENLVVKYANGPILKKSNQKHLKEYTVIANYASEISDNNTTKGVVLNTPAFLTSNYKKGVVFLIGPHPEDTPGSKHVLIGVVGYLLKIS